jgi:hypothetical protein
MKNKMYSNPPRKPMMYGGTTMKPKQGMPMDGSGKMMYGGMANKKK